MAARTLQWTRQPSTDFDPVGAGLIAVSAATLFLWLVLRPGSPPTFATGDNIGQFAGPLLMLVWNGIALGQFAMSRARSREPLTREQAHRLRTCLLLLTAIACNTSGQMIWTWLEDVVHRPHPFPGPADVPWVATYVFQILGFLSLSVRPLPARTRLRVLLDGLILLTVLFTFGWYYEVGPMVLHSGASRLATFVGACYPLGDLLVLFCLLLIASIPAQAHREYTGALAVGLVFVIFADVVFSYGNVHGTYRNGLTDIGWPVGYMISGYVARQLLMKARRGEGVAAEQESLPARLMSWRSLLPYAGIPPLGALTYYVWTVRDDPQLGRGVLVGAGILGGFLIVRQLIVLAENQHLYAILHRANLDLKARTAEARAYGEQMERLNKELRKAQLDLLTNNIALSTANSQLEHRATQDSMTGLANHRAFQERLRDELDRSRHSNGTLALLLLDVDCFKEYNDAYGHPAGDGVLRTVAELIAKSARHGDLVARYGGEEFAVLLPDTNELDAMGVAERIRAEIERYDFRYRGVTVSAGIAYHEGGSGDPEMMVRIADEALYIAKRNGRNRVVYEKAA